MKAKSTKLRMLVTMHTIFKHADAEHRINCKDMEKYLEPYGLKNSREALRDTVRVMREFGIDIKRTGECDSCGLWIDNRPLNRADLDRLVFAVSTNPHISSKQASEILKSLTPIVSSHLEDRLVTTVLNDNCMIEDDLLYSVYSVINDAIRADKRVCFFTEEIKYDRKAKAVFKQRSIENLFAPKCIVHKNGRLFAVGYNCTRKRVQAVDLRDIKEIISASNRPNKMKDTTEKVLDGLEATNCVPRGNEELIYRGEATFFCRGPLTKMLYNKFGPPTGEVEKDITAKTTYTVADAVITPQTLHWLANGEGRGIKITAPQEARNAVRQYYAKTAKDIVGCHNK